MFWFSFSFLDAKDVWLFISEPFGEAFFEDGSDAVDVPGDDFHRFQSLNMGREASRLSFFGGKMLNLSFLRGGFHGDS